MEEDRRAIFPNSGLGTEPRELLLVGTSSVATIVEMRLRPALAAFMSLVKEVYNIV